VATFSLHSARNCISEGNFIVVSPAQGSRTLQQRSIEAVSAPSLVRFAPHDEAIVPAASE
jgi:hypothetical protein